VDENFEKLLQRRLDKRWEKLSPEQRKKTLNTEWEYGIKRLFEDDEREWNVRLPAEATRHSFGGIGNSVFRKKSSKREDASIQDAKLRRGNLKLNRYISFCRAILFVRANSTGITYVKSLIPS
jgi:hypothetical protein